MPPKGRPSYKKKPSALKRGHPAIQNIKFLKFFIFLWAFFLSWRAGSRSLSGSGFRIWIQIPNLDPDTDPLIWFNPDTYGSNPDPKHWVGSVPGFRIRNFFTDLDPGGQLIMDPSRSGFYLDALVVIEITMYKQVIWFLLYFYDQLKSNF